MIRPLRPSELKAVLTSVKNRLSGDSLATGSVVGDVFEGTDSYVIDVDAPGVSESDIQLRYIDTDVYIRMDRYRPARTEYEFVTGNRPMRFEGTISLPHDAVVDPTDANATLRSNGTLRIHLPKGSSDDTEGDTESPMTRSTEETDGE